MIMIQVPNCSEKFFKKVVGQDFFISGLNLFVFAERFDYKKNSFFVSNCKLVVAFKKALEKIPNSEMKTLALNALNAKISKQHYDKRVISISFFKAEEIMATIDTVGEY